MANYQGLKEVGIALLSSTATCNLAAAPGTEKSLYTVPVGKTAVIHTVVMRTFSADCTTAVVTFGHTGGAMEEWSGNVTLTGITASYAEQCVILQPVPATTPLAKSFFTAGEVFGMEITTSGAASTCTIDVFGYLF